MRIRFRLQLLFTVIFLVVTSISFSSPAQQAAPKRDQPDDAKSKTKRSRFIQLRTNKGKPAALQIAISRYASKDGKSKATVDLVGVVHIGDKAYYEKLNQLLKQYDVVLYELVAPEGTRIDKQALEQNQNPLRMLQSVPQKMMHLDSQLEQVNYRAKNFVHADLTPAEIAAKMAERGESTLTLALDTVSEMIRKQNLAQSKGDKVQESGSEDLLGLIEMMNDPSKMKMMMAKQFVESEAMDMGLGTSLNRILIKDRNEEAMKELGRQLFAGHKKIAIFYGAAHMPDFEKRLQKELALVLKKQTWLDAWDLTRKTNSGSDDPGEMLLRLLKELGG